MKAILVLVAALQLAAAQKLTYRYEAQSVIGIPESGKDFNVIKAEFIITAQAVTGGNRAVAQIAADSIKIGNYTGRVFPIPEGIISWESLPGALQMSISQDAKDSFKTQLVKPISFSRGSNGQIDDIKHQTDDPFWSVNLKKGALSVMQLRVDPDKSKVVYTVDNEADITGTCPSTYVVQPRQHYHGHEHEAVNFFNVTKSRDYSKCSNRTLVRLSFFTGTGLSDDEAANKAIISNAKFAYNVSGSRDKFVVEGASAEGQHIFTVFRPLSGSLTVYTHQKLTLIDQSAASLDAEPATINFGCGFSMNIPNVAQSDTKAGADVVLPELAAFADSIIGRTDVSNHEKGIYLKRLIERMRGANFDAWVALAQKIKDNPAKAKLLMDLAPVTGTLESIKGLRSGIENDLATENITAQFFGVLSLFGEPTLAMVKEVAAICQLDKVSSKFRLQKSCLLSLSSLLHNRYIRNNLLQTYGSWPQEEKDFRTEIMKYLTGLVGTLVKTGDDDKRLLALSIVGNGGYNETLNDVLKPIINDDSFSSLIRSRAIRAMRRFPACNYATMQNILLPVFTDWHNDIEVRLAAYRMLMGTRPKQDIFDLVSAALHTEHDEHIISYVTSHLKVMAKNPVLGDEEQGQKARIALQGLTMVPPQGIQYSRYYRLVDTYDDDRNAGFELDVSVVGCSRNLLPKEVCIWGQGVVHGTKVNVAHVCLRLQGLQKALNRILRPGQPVQEAFLEQLNLNNVNFEDYQGHLELAVQGSDVQFFSIPAIISAVLDNPSGVAERVGGYIQALQTPLRKALVLDSTIQIPSLIGLPVHLNTSHIMFMNSSLSGVYFKPNCRLNPTEFCEAGFEPRISWKIGSQHALGVDAVFLQSYVLLHGMIARQRGDARKWSVQWKSMQSSSDFTFEALLPQDKVVTLRTEILPFLVTVDRTAAAGPRQYSIQEWRSWHSDAVADETFSFSTPKSSIFTGFVFGMNRTKTSCLPFMPSPNRPRPPFCGKVIREFYVQPKGDAPDKLSVNYKYDGPQLEVVKKPVFRSAMTQDDVKDMIDDLTKLDEKIDDEMHELEDLQEHLAVETEDSAADVEEEMHHDDEENNGFLARKKRGVGRNSNRDGYKMPQRGDKRVKVDKPDKQGKKRAKTLVCTTTVEIKATGGKAEDRSLKLEVQRSRDDTDQNKIYRKGTLVATKAGKTVGQVCFDSKVKYPKEYTSLLTGSGEPKWEYSGEFKYGQDSCSNEVKVEITASQSDEQKRVIKDFVAKNKYSGNYWVYLCLKEREKGYKYTWPCRHLFTELNEVHRLKIEMTAKEMSKMEVLNIDLRKIISGGLQYLRYWRWKNLKTGFTRDVKTGDDAKKITFEGVRNFQLPLLTNYTIRTPESTNEFSNVILKHSPSSLYFPTYWSFSYHASGWQLPGACTIQRKGEGSLVVSTFDNVVYEISRSCTPSKPLTVLLAMDCSSLSKFIVSATFDPTTKQISLVATTSAAKVELKIPNSDDGTGRQVLVDGIAYTTSQRLFVDDTTEVEIGFDNIGASVRLKGPGVFIKHTNDNAIVIGASPLYGGLTCGWCGDYNGEKFDEFTTAAGDLTNDVKKFEQSYVAGLDTCT